MRTWMLGNTHDELYQIYSVDTKLAIFKSKIFNKTLSWHLCSNYRLDNILVFHFLTVPFAVFTCKFQTLIWKDKQYSVTGTLFSNICLKGLTHWKVIHPVYQRLYRLIIIIILVKSFNDCRPFATEEYNVYISNWIDAWCCRFLLCSPYPRRNFLMANHLFISKTNSLTFYNLFDAHFKRLR